MSQAWRYGLFAALSLALVFGLLFVFSPSNEPPSGALEPFTSILDVAGLNVGHIRDITLSDGKQEVTFAREGEDWRILSPFKAAASTAQLGHLLRLMAATEARPGNDAAWVPAEGDAEFSIALDQRRFDLIHRPSGGTWMRYAGKVYAVGPLPVFGVDLDGNDYLETRLLPEHIHLNELRLPEFTLTKKDNGAWKATPEQNAGSDELAALATEWKLAYAVRARYGEMKKEETKKVSIYYEDDSRKLNSTDFNILSLEPLRLYDPAARITYFLADGIANALLHVQPMPDDYYQGDTVRLQ